MFNIKASGENFDIVEFQTDDIFNVEIKRFINKEKNKNYKGKV